jgi:hypothetical protein
VDSRHVLIWVLPTNSPILELPALLVIAQTIPGHTPIYNQGCRNGFVDEWSILVEANQTVNL